MTTCSVTLSGAGVRAKRTEGKPVYAGWSYSSLDLNGGSNSNIDILVLLPSEPKSRTRREFASIYRYPAHLTRRRTRHTSGVPPRAQAGSLPGK